MVPTSDHNHPKKVPIEPIRRDPRFQKWELMTRDFQKNHGIRWTCPIGRIAGHISNPITRLYEQKIW